MNGIQVYPSQRGAIDQQQYPGHHGLNLDRMHCDQKPVLPCNNVLYPNIPQQDYSVPAHVKISKGTQREKRGRAVTGAYESGEEL